MPEKRVTPGKHWFSKYVWANLEMQDLFHPPEHQTPDGGNSFFFF